MEPIIPGSAAAAFPARLANSLPRLLYCFSIQFFTQSFGGGLCVVDPPPVVGIIASTITPIIIPKAVKTLTIVIPCHLNNVLILLPNVVSSFNTLLIVSFILFT